MDPVTLQNDFTALIHWGLFICGSSTTTPFPHTCNSHFGSAVLIPTHPFGSPHHTNGTLIINVPLLID